MRKWAKLLAVLAMVVAACGDDGGGATTVDGGDGTTATTGDGGGEVGASFALFGAPTGVEGEALQGFVDVYNEETGSSITYRGSDNFESELRIAVEGGNPPEVAFVPQPSSICAFADAGNLVSLEDMGFDIAKLESDHSKYWMDLGVCADGNHYGLPWFPNYKSIVFYHLPTFEANGYEVPETYDDLVALSAQMVTDGQTPWCFGYGAGDATGWAGTDWIEDIFVRMHGADAYADWYNHEIPFNDPMVVATFDKFGEIFNGEGFILGGKENVPSIIVEESPGPMFQDPDPGCAMLKQGSFATNFFEQAPEYEDGEESEIGVFNFPTIDGNPGAMGGGDTMIVFEQNPGVVQAITDWISPDWQCTLASGDGGGIAPFGGHGVAGVERLPGNANTDPNCYDSESGKTFAEGVTAALAANTFVFDASDLMPPEVGQATFWQGMIDYAGGATSQEVTDTVEASWPAG